MGGENPKEGEVGNKMKIEAPTRSRRKSRSILHFHSKKKGGNFQKERRKAKRGGEDET